MCQEGRENAQFRAHYLFWAKKSFGPKQCEPGNTIKIVVSAEIAQNQKMTPFLEKGVLDMGEKVGLLTVFLKSCVYLKTLIFILFSDKHSSCNTNTVNKKQKIDEK